MEPACSAFSKGKTLFLVWWSESPKVLQCIQWTINIIFTPVWFHCANPFGDIQHQGVKHWAHSQEITIWKLPLPCVVKTFWSLTLLQLPAVRMEETYYTSHYFPSEVKMAIPRNPKVAASSQCNGRRWSKDRFPMWSRWAILHSCYSETPFIMERFFFWVWNNKLCCN